MRRIILVLLVCLLVLCGCQNTDYKDQIFSLVEENGEILNRHILTKDSVSNVTAELSCLSIHEIEVVDDIIVFEMYYTGLFDGGVEYGFYYTESDKELNKQFSSNDYMIIEEITDNWYYYEWHNG